MTALQQVRPTKPAMTDPPEPPDGGWAWVVLGGSFLAQLLVFGFYGGAAVYVPVWMEFFDSLAVETSLIISLSSCFMGLLSLVAGVLITRFGVRAVWMAGGVITSVGLLISALATSTLYLVFSMSFITALGFSMCVNSGFVALSQYFKKRLTLAVGVASAGFAAGQLVLTPLFNYLIDEYGWRGSLVIFAGILMHMVAAGAFVRPLPFRARKRNMKKLKGIQSGTSNTESNTKTSGHSQEKRRQEGLGEEARPQTNNESSQTVSTDSPLQDDTVCFDDKTVLWLSNDEDCVVTEDISPRAGVGVALKDTERISVAGSGAAAATKQLCDLNQSGNTHAHSSPADFESISPEISAAKPTSSPPFTDLCKRYISRLCTFMLDRYGLSGLFHNPSFVLTIPVGIAHGFGWASVVFHLSARAESVGLLPTEGANLLAIMGGGAFATSVSHGWFVDRWNISPILTYIAAIICNGLVCLIMAPLVTFGPMAATSVLFGMATGVAEPLIFVILQALVRPSEVAGAISIFLVCWGAGEITGASLAGLIYDTIKSYNNAYYMSASMFIIAAILGTVIYILERRKMKSKEQLLNGTADISLAVKCTVDERNGPHSNEDGQNGIVNPMYAAGDNNEGMGQVFSEASKQQTTGIDRMKFESGC